MKFENFGSIHAKIRESAGNFWDFKDQKISDVAPHLDPPPASIYAGGGDFSFAGEVVNKWAKSNHPEIHVRLLRGRNFRCSPSPSSYPSNLETLPPPQAKLVGGNQREGAFRLEILKNSKCKPSPQPSPAIGRGRFMDFDWNFEVVVSHRSSHYNSKSHFPPPRSAWGRDKREGPSA